MSTKAVVLHSGGLDSTVCLLMAIANGREVISLGIDYGQRHRIELDYAAHLCKKLEVSRVVLSLSWHKPLHPIPENRPIELIRKSISPAFLPGRNIVFLTLACAEAAGIGAKEVWIGVNAVDFSGYPDCRPEFIEAFRRMINEGIPDGPKIVAPLLSMTKPQIAAKAELLGLSRGDTWSCYQPQFSPNGISPCGRCDACILHAYAWANAHPKQ